MKKHNRFAGRALSLLCALCFLALLPAGCTPAEETPDGPVLTVDGRSFAVESRNALSGVSLLDRGYRSEDGSPSAVCILPQDGAVAYFSFVLTDGAANSHWNVLPAPRESAYTSPQTAASFTCRRSLHGEPTLEGYAPDTEGYIDLTAGACVTDESGRTGFALTHKSVDSLEEGMTGVLMSAGDPELALSAPYVGMKVKRGVARELPHHRMGRAEVRQGRVHADPARRIRAGVCARLLRRRRRDLLLEHKYDYEIR